MSSSPAGGIRRPPGRYGPPRRRTGFVVAVAVTAAVVGLVIWTLVRDFGPAPVSGTVVTFRIADDEITMRVAIRKPADRAAECVLRSRGADGAEVARRTVTVPVDADGRRTRTYEYVLRTPRPGITAELSGCRLLPTAVEPSAAT